MFMHDLLDVTYSEKLLNSNNDKSIILRDVESGKGFKVQLSNFTEYMLKCRELWRTLCIKALEENKV